MFLSEIFHFKISSHKIKENIVEVRFFPAEMLILMELPTLVKKHFSRKCFTNRTVRKYHSALPWTHTVSALNRTVLRIQTSSYTGNTVYASCLSELEGSIVLSCSLTRYIRV